MYSYSYSAVASEIKAHHSAEIKTRQSSVSPIAACKVKCKWASLAARQTEASTSAAAPSEKKKRDGESEGEKEAAESELASLRPPCKVEEGAQGRQVQGPGVLQKSEYRHVYMVEKLAKSYCSLVFIDE